MDAGVTDEAKMIRTLVENIVRVIVGGVTARYTALVEETQKGFISLSTAQRDAATAIGGKIDQLRTKSFATFSAINDDGSLGKEAVMTPDLETSGGIRTGAELWAARKAHKLSRKALAGLSVLHMDTVRYWERKPRLDLRGHAVTRMLDVLGCGEWRKREVEVRTLERMRNFDMRQMLVLPETKPIPTERTNSNGVFFEANIVRAGHGVLEGSEAALAVRAGTQARNGVLESAAEWEQYARTGVRHGVSENADKPNIKAGPQTCGAKTRAGHPCRNRAIFESGRCKNHGGMSTGPRTPEGRERIAEAQRQRWARIVQLP